MTRLYQLFANVLMLRFMRDNIATLPLHRLAIKCKVKLFNDVTNKKL